MSKAKFFKVCGFRRLTGRAGIDKHLSVDFSPYTPFYMGDEVRRWRRLLWAAMGSLGRSRMGSGEDFDF